MRSTPRPITALLLLLGCLTVGPTASAQDTPAQPEPQTAEPAPQPQPPPTLVVHDLFVVQIDKYGQRANDPTQVRTTLARPIRHKLRRQLVLDNAKGYADQPMPLGLISFEGKIQSPMTMKIELLGDQAQVHAHHPYDAQTDDRSIRWLNLHEAAPTQRAERIGGGGHWLEALRDAEDRLWIASRDTLRKERFMLYDAAFAFTPALSLAMNDQTYIVKSTLAAEQTPPLTILVHHPNQDWAARSVAGPWDKAQTALGEKPEDPDRLSPILKPVLKPLADLLAQRGYNPTEIDLALGMVASAGLDNSAMSLVYVMPQGMIDNYIQLELRPKPDRVIRTAIVVLTNADPDLASRVKRLIADLGSDQWQQRNEAQRALDAMGQAAIKQLQEQRSNSDPEIAFRAQQLLESYDLKTEQDR